MSLRRGFTFASASVVLVSSAQLGMRWSMTRLPEPTHWLDALRHGEVSLAAVAVVSGAIVAYALSMLCWLLALRDLPLGRAYSLLSISYALVYLLAASLPFWHALRQQPRLCAALAGVNAGVVGLLLAALYDPVWTSSIHSAGDLVLALLAFIALQFWRLPPWLVVLGCGVTALLLAAL